MRWSLGCLPVVGLLCGGLVFGWTRLTAAFPVSPLFFAAVAVLLPILLAGGLHMDGFLDATDALFSRRDREKKLAIMKDPNCGPFAVLCCAGLLLLEAGAWCQLMTAPGLLPAACSVYLLSRSLTVVAGSRFPYTPSSTLGVLFASRAAKGVAALGTVETALSLLLLLGLGGTLRRMAGAAGRRCNGDRRRPALLVVPLHDPAAVRRHHRRPARFFCGTLPVGYAFSARLGLHVRLKGTG